MSNHKYNLETNRKGIDFFFNYSICSKLIRYVYICNWACVHDCMHREICSLNDVHLGSYKCYTPNPTQPTNQKKPTKTFREDLTKIWFLWWSFIWPPFTHTMSLYAFENEENTMVTCPSTCAVSPAHPECFMHFLVGLLGWRSGRPVHSWLHITGSTLCSPFSFIFKLILTFIAWVALKSCIYFFSVSKPFSHPLKRDILWSTSKTRTDTVRASQHLPSFGCLVPEQSQKRKYRDYLRVIGLQCTRDHVQ